MEKVILKAQKIMENATGNVYDIYFVLFKECILDQEYPEQILHKILEEAQEHEFSDDETPEKVDKEKIKTTRNTYLRLLQEYVLVLTRENMEVAEFYRKLYNGVFKSGIFPEDEETQSILLCLLAEAIVEIPYYQANNMLSMTGAEYKNAVLRLRPQIQKVIYMLNRHFRSRTEEASQIYEVISRMDNREDKIILLSVLIYIIQKNASLSERKSEEE